MSDDDRIGWQEAFDQLRAGNARFASGEPAHPHESFSRRAELEIGQQPIAAVLGCADSRVPPELIFDQGLGDLFVLRVAGNILDDAVLASLEYAVGHLGVPLIVVLGHAGCGAVAAALGGAETEGHLPVLTDAIAPALRIAQGRPGDPVDEAARANARLVAEKVRAAGPLLAGRVREGALKIAAAFYDLRTGEVEFPS